VIAAVLSATREIAMVQPETGCKLPLQVAQAVLSLCARPMPLRAAMRASSVHNSHAELVGAHLRAVKRCCVRSANCGAPSRILRRMGTSLRLRFKHRVLCLGIRFLVEIVVISGHIGSQQIRAAREYQ